MASLQLLSNNPDLGYIIKKNPNGTPLGRLIRKGVAFGWFQENSPSIYNVVFLDHPDKVSFAMNDESYNYLDNSRYTSLLFFFNVLDEFFSDAYKKENDKDVEGSFNVLCLNSVYIKDINYAMMLKNYFDFYINFKELGASLYEVRFCYNGKLYDFLNKLSIFLLLLSSKNEEIYLSEDKIEKYTRQITRINLPYWIIYLFKTKFIRSKRMFEQLKPALESMHPGLNLTILSNYDSRKTWVLDKFSENKTLNIIDFGCGEGNYIPLLVKRMESNGKYFAVDKDSDELEKATRLVNRKELTKQVNLSTELDFALLDENKTHTILLSEVVEHIHEDGLVTLLNKIASFKAINQIIITTPNVDFNKHYILEKGKRHEDHVKEYNEFELLKLLTENFTEDVFSIKSEKVGDSINNVSTTMGFVITRK